MRKICCCLLLICLLVGLTIPVAAAQSCGADLTWQFSQGVLTISGTGAMTDFDIGGPWIAHKAEITKVVLEGVTYVGANAFTDYDALVQVDFGDAIYELGPNSFRDCDALTSLYFPSSFKIFGESCLLSCEKLTKIYSEGNFPSFRQNSLWDTYATIYYPADRPWLEKNIQDLEKAFHGRIHFLATDGTDIYETTAPTTEETTVATTTETTAEPTVETTVAPTTETAPAESQNTLPTASQPETNTTPDTGAVPTEPEEKDSPLLLIGIIVILVVLCGVAIYLISEERARVKRKKRRRPGKHFQ